MFAVFGCVIGTLVGMLPGVGPLAGICLLPATFGLHPTTVIVLLPGIYYGAMYGGSTTAEKVWWVYRLSRTYSRA